MVSAGRRQGAAGSHARAGRHVLSGRGRAAGTPQAARWYQLASDKGYPKAKVYLAECYELGKAGLPRNYDKSFQLLNEALALDPNNAAATEKLAEQYEQGRGTAPDAMPRVQPDEARGGPRQRAGHRQPRRVLHERVRAEGQTRPRLLSLFKQGVDEEQRAVHVFLRAMPGEGLGRRDRNPREAVGYYRAAAERGFPPARDWCNQHRVNFRARRRTAP